MNKLAKLKSVAKSMAAGGILGSGAGVASHIQIQKNKNSARTTKGWETKRINAITKKAEVETSALPELKSAIRSLGSNMNRPSHAIADFAKRSLLFKVRRMMASKPVHTTTVATGGFNAR